MRCHACRDHEDVKFDSTLTKIVLELPGIVCSVPVLCSEFGLNSPISLPQLVNDDYAQPTETDIGLTTQTLKSITRVPTCQGSPDYRVT